MKRFDLTDVQATAILDLRLCQLAKLEESKLKEEQAKVAAERNDLEKTLDSKARLKALIRKELIADAKRYGDPRRSPLAGGEDMAEAATFAESELIANEPITVTLSEKGWVRSAKGYDLDPANWPTAAATPSAMRPGAAATTFWLSWTLPAGAHNLPATSLPSARTQGEPLTGRLKPPEGTRFVGTANSRVLRASDAGYGFIATLEDLLTKNRAGKAYLSTPKDSAALPRPRRWAGRPRQIHRRRHQSRLPPSLPPRLPAHPRPRQGRQAHQHPPHRPQSRRRAPHWGRGLHNSPIFAWIRGLLL